jgi:hypothetical protein
MFINYGAGEREDDLWYDCIWWEYMDAIYYALVHAYWKDRVEGIYVPGPFVSALLYTLISGSSLRIRIDVPFLPHPIWSRPCQCAGHSAVQGSNQRWHLLCLRYSLEES